MAVYVLIVLCLGVLGGLITLGKGILNCEPKDQVAGLIALIIWTLAVIFQSLTM